MSVLTFNQEIRKLITLSNNPTLIYVNNKFNESKYCSYFEFFENYLYKYGIKTVGYSTVTNSQIKFSPYVNCKEINIFREPKGNKNITDSIYSVKKCQIICANYIISNLKMLAIKDLESWEIN